MPGVVASSGRRAGVAHAERSWRAAAGASRPGTVLALAARLMRRILVDRGRARARLKRGAGHAAVSLDDVDVAAPEPDRELQALDAALEELATFDPRKAQVVDLVFFGGLTYDEAADALAISRATLHRDLRLAKAWLHAQVGGPPEAAAGA